MNVLLSVSDLNEPVGFMMATDQASMSSSNFPGLDGPLHAHLFEHHLHRAGGPREIALQPGLVQDGHSRRLRKVSA